MTATIAKLNWSSMTGRQLNSALNQGFTVWWITLSGPPHVVHESPFFRQKRSYAVRRDLKAKMIEVYERDKS